MAQKSDGVTEVVTTTAPDVVEQRKNKKKKQHKRASRTVPDGYRLEPPEGGFGWIVLGGVLVVTTMIAIPGTAFGILMADIRNAMDTSTAVVATAPSISMSMSNFISPLVTIAIHTFGCRPTAFFGGFIIAAGLILSFFARSIYYLIVVYGIFTGIGYGFCRIACLVLASNYFCRRYNIAASCIFTGFSLGRLIFSPLVQLCNERYGYRGTFLLMGGIVTNVCVGAALFQPARWHYVLRPIANFEVNKNTEVKYVKNGSSNEIDGTVQLPGSSSSTEPSPKSKSEPRKSGDALDFGLLKEPVFYIILGSQVLTYLSLMYGILFLVPLGLDKGLSPMQAAIVPTFRAFAEIGGRIGFPLLQVVSTLDPIRFYIFTCIVAMLGFIAQAFAEGYIMILITALITGFMTGGTVVQNTTIILYSVGRKKLPSTLGLCAFFQGFFTLVGGPLIGWVRDTTGSFVAGYLLIAAFQGACAVVWIYQYFRLYRQGKIEAYEDPD